MTENVFVTPRDRQDGSFLCLLCSGTRHRKRAHEEFAADADSFHLRFLICDW